MQERTKIVLAIVAVVVILSIVAWLAANQDKLEERRVVRPNANQISNE